MIDIHRPQSSPKHLLQQLEGEIQQSQFLNPSPVTSSAYREAQMEHINIILNGAEAMAQPRTTLPKKIRHWPILKNSKVQRVLLKIYNFLFKEYRTVNLATIQAVRQSVQINQQINQQISEQMINLTAISQELNAVVSDRLTALVHQSESNTRLTSHGIEALESRLQISDRTLQFIEKNYGDRLRYLQADISQQKRLMTLLLEQQSKESKVSLSEETSTPKTESIQSSEELQLDVFYRALEDKFRGEHSQIRGRLEVYLPFLQETDLKTSGDSIVDVGCGRGEWLQLLQDNGYNGLGLDINQAMLEQCQELGLSVLGNDALSYLKSLPDNTLGGVTGFHIVEHLPFEYLIQMLAESYRVVRPGGVIIFETQNPHNVLVGSCNFYFDPTHRNPIPPELLEFMAQYAGFGMARTMPLNPSDYPHVLENSDLAHRFNELFYGSMDYAVIGIKE
jgi:SAM-dependent methyltransferase